MDNKKIENIIIDYLKVFNPSMVGLFGSFSRHEQTMKSDLDVLIDFKNPISLLKLVKIENDLSKRLGIKVDLVTVGAVRNKKIRESIYQDLKVLFNDE